MADYEEYQLPVTTAEDASSRMVKNYRANVSAESSPEEPSHDKTATDMMRERTMGSFRNNARSKYGQ